MPNALFTSRVEGSECAMSSGVRWAKQVLRDTGRKHRSCVFSSFHVLKFHV